MMGFFFGESKYLEN